MTDSEDEGWRFAVDEVGADAADEDEAERESEADTDDAEQGGNVAGAFTLQEDIEPGQPTAENAFFVALGVAVTLLLFLSVAGII